MNGADDRIMEEAAAWHVASATDAMDWDGFTRWLEADPAHARAYDEVALSDGILGEHGEELREAGVPETSQPAPRRLARRPWFGMAVAASLVAVLAVPRFLDSGAQTYATGAQSRTVALADGSTVTIAPHSRLEVSRGEAEMALDGGAWFDIRHDPLRQLAITAGGTRISDIGTRFDVQTGEGAVRVAVAEGRVEVSAEGMDRPLQLAQGRALRFDARRGTALVAPLAPERIGEWRQGRLSYEGAPLSLVAADLSRYAGLRVTVPDTLAARQFSGTLFIGHGEAAVRDLSQLMDLELRRDAGGYRLSGRR